MWKCIFDQRISWQAQLAVTGRACEGALASPAPLQPSQALQISDCVPAGQPSLWSCKGSTNTPSLFTVTNVGTMLSDGTGGRVRKFTPQKLDAGVVQP